MISERYGLVGVGRGWCRRGGLADCRCAPNPPYDFIRFCRGARVGMYSWPPHPFRGDPSADDRTNPPRYFVTVRENGGHEIHAHSPKCRRDRQPGSQETGGDAWWFHWGCCDGLDVGWFVVAWNGGSPAASALRFFPREITGSNTILPLFTF